MVNWFVDMRFLSTPSGWRATFTNTFAYDEIKISIHALRVEGDKEGETFGVMLKISIHALRVEGDGIAIGAELAEKKISIHALRVEGDMRYQTSWPF